MTCWTCHAEHDPDVACGTRPAPRPAVMPGAHDLFDDALEPRSGPGKPFTATYDGEDACCGDGIEEGDTIRADGHGGWIHANGECDA